MPKLTPTESVAHLSAIDQERNLAMAMMEASVSPSFEAQHRAAFRAQAKPLLEKVYEAGLRDAETLRLLTDLYSATDLQRASQFARESLELKDAPLHTRGSALMWLSTRAMQDGDFRSAIDRLQQFNQGFNTSEGWRLLATCYLQQNQPAKALSALEKALALKPYSSTNHDTLAETYRQLNRPGLAQEHREKAQMLLKLRQD